jgi:hypothetical protein
VNVFLTTGGWENFPPVSSQTMWKKHTTDLFGDSSRFIRTEFKYTGKFDWEKTSLFTSMAQSHRDVWIFL